MIFFRIAIIVFSILLLSCNDSKNKQQDNFISAKPEIKNFLFVGLINDKAGLYKFNLDRKIYEPFWADEKEEVVELSYSKEMENCFFITAKKFSRTGAFPFINNVKLYLLNPKNGKADFIEEIGNGIQVFTQWEGENNFKIIINSFDKIIANYVYHRKILFNIYGKKLEDISETYDITKQGYPQPAEKINYYSPDEKYFIENRETDSTGIYLKEKESEKLISKNNQQIRQIEWTNELLIFSTKELNQAYENQSYLKNGASKIIGYSLKYNKTLMNWKDENIKDFYTSGSILIYDCGFGKDSHIIIYNLQAGEVLAEIKNKEGCGLKSIHQIFDNGM